MNANLLDAWINYSRPLLLYSQLETSLERNDPFIDVSYKLNGLDLGMATLIIDSENKELTWVSFDPSVFSKKLKTETPQMSLKKDLIENGTFYQTLEELSSKENNFSDYNLKNKIGQEKTISVYELQKGMNLNLQGDSLEKTKLEFSDYLDNMFDNLGLNR